MKNFRLYAITDLRSDDPDILNQVLRAFRGGVDIVQLRSKMLSDRAFLRIGKKVLAVARKYKKLLIVNDRPDLMLALDADGVHLGQEDVPIDVARQIIRGRNKIIGKSTHSLEQALKAEREGADYIGFGPIFKTPTKPTYPPVGVKAIGAVAKQVKIPVVCIGGIDATNVQEVIAHGARRVAVVRAIFASQDAFQAARMLRRLMGL